MYTIIEHIEYLLTSHDCVVIPGWGALVAQYGESHYNPVAGHIERPRREVGFNASVNHNDGMLAQSIVRREGISYDDAMRVVSKSVSMFRQQLSQGNEVSLGRLGFFKSTDDQRIEFIPFYHERSNDNYFGLHNVKLRPLSEEAHRAEAAAAFAPQSPRRHAWSRPLQVAASILVLLCLTVVLTTPVIVNRNHQDYATLNLPKVTMPQQQVLDMTAADNGTQQAPADHPTEQEANVEPASSLLLDEGGNSLLVVASLSSMEQVEVYKQHHADLADKMQVSKASKKLYHVYVARSNDKKHLYALKAQLPDKYKKAWVKP